MSSSVPSEGFDNFYSICGFLGGLVFAIALIPQVHKTYTTKSAGDLSYFWQFAYMIGLIGLNVYMVANKLWPVAGPSLGDLFIMALLTWMKFYYDNIYPKKQSAIKQLDVDDDEAGKPTEKLGEPAEKSGEESIENSDSVEQVQILEGDGGKRDSPAVVADDADPDEARPSDALTGEKETEAKE